VAPTADDAALAARIAPVLGDEEATDEVPGAVPAPAVAPTSPTPVAGQRPWARWAVWAALVAAVAVAARAMLRPSASGRA